MKTKLLTIFLVCASWGALAQPMDSTFFYVNGSPFFVCQQPDICSFKLIDNSEYSGTFSTSIVQGVEFYPGEGIHYIHFTPTATTMQKASVALAVESDPLFEKFFMVGTKSYNFDKECNKGKWMGTNNNICITFDDPDISNAAVDAFAASYETTVVYYAPATIGNGVYILQVNRSINGFSYDSPTLTIDLAREMWENDADIIGQVDPSLRIFRPEDPNDPFYSQMWFAEGNSNLCNGTPTSPTADIGLDCAWNYMGEFSDEQYISGDGIVVGVIDFDGAEYTHPDCIGMYQNGRQAPSTTSPDIVVPIVGDTYNSPVDFRAHGQNVSGIIGARFDNAEGMAGVAHNCKIMPLLFTGHTGQFAALLQEALAQTGVFEVDVINMSFGYSGMTIPDAMGFTFYSALFNCDQLGRGTEGMILIASAGNDNANIAQVPAGIDFVFSVGATNPLDQRKEPGDLFDGTVEWGSNYFSDLDVVAPGVCIISTDFTDDNHPTFPDPYGDGYVTGNYYSFLGTSASAPIVSGIAALVLEKDPTLTNDEVYDAIRYSCEKISGYTYDVPGATGRALEVGFGRVNACEALQTINTLDVEENVNQLPFTFINPVEDILQINFTTTSQYNVVLTNVAGQIVFESITPASGNYSVDMFNLSKGIYFLKVIDLTDSSISTVKIVKN